MSITPLYKESIISYKKLTIMLTIEDGLNSITKFNKEKNISNPRGFL